MALEPKWLITKDVATVYGIKEKRLKKLRERTVHRKEGNRYVYSVESIEEYVNSTSQKPNFKTIYVDRFFPVDKKEVGQKRAIDESPNSKGGATKMPKWNQSRKKDGTPKDGRYWLNLGDLTLKEYQGKRGIHFGVDFRQGDTRRTKSLSELCGQPIDSREEALGALEPVRRKLYDEAKKPYRPNSDPTVSQLIPDFLEEKREDRERSFRGVETAVVNRLEPYFGKKLLKDLSTDFVKGYRDHRRRQGIKDISIWNNELCHLRELYKFAMEKGYVSGPNPVDKKKLKIKIKKRERYMMTTEEKKIWPLLKKHHPLDDMADFILDNAMRPANECDLQWSWIYWDERLAIVPAEYHKQKTAGKYSLSDKIITMLERRKKEAEKFNDDFPYVFWREENGKRYKITTRWIQDHWLQVMAEAGIEDLHFYDLKHTCLSRLAALGYTEFQLQSISNHLSIVSLARYVQPDLMRLSGKSRDFLNKRNEVYGKVSAEQE